MDKNRILQLNKLLNEIEDPKEKEDLLFDDESENLEDDEEEVEEGIFNKKKKDTGWAHGTAADKRDRDSGRRESHAFSNAQRKNTRRKEDYEGPPSPDDDVAWNAYYKKKGKTPPKIRSEGEVEEGIFDKFNKKKREDAIQYDKDREQTRQMVNRRADSMDKPITTTPKKKKTNEAISYSQVETLARTISSMNNRELVELVEAIGRISTRNQSKLVKKAFIDLL